MRLTIVPEDRSIIIDGKVLLRIRQDLSWIPSNIHAVQWYHDYGEVEYKDGKPNEKITSLGIYEQAVIDYNNELEMRLREIEESRDYWEEFRGIRNQYLFNSDWTQFSDSPLLDDKKLEWQLYRQKLRELPEIITDPKPLVLDSNHPDWPVLPT
jgi:hypothetical protein